MVKKKITIYIILAVLVLSIVFRMFLGYHWRDSFFNRGNNYSLINPIALNLIKGNGFTLSPGNPSIEHELLYPIFVAVCYALFGYNWFGVVLFQSIISMLTALLVYSMTKKLFSANVAIISLFLTIFHPYLFIQVLSVSDTTIFIFFLILSFWQAVNLSEHPTTINAILMGIFISLLLLTRDSAIAFIIPLCIYIFISIDAKRRLNTYLFIIISMFVLVAPWIIRNYIVSKKILLSSHGYEVLWQGNNPYSYDYISNDISVDEIPKPKVIKELSQRYTERTTELVVLEGQLYLDEVRQFITRNPVTFTKLLFLKFSKFWSWKYNPKPRTTAFISLKSRTIACTAYFLPLLIFAITGVILSYTKRKNFVIFCLLFFLCFSLIHMLSVGFTRLRVPLDPLLTIFASYGFLSICIKIKSRLKLKNDGYYCSDDVSLK